MRLGLSPILSVPVVLISLADAPVGASATDFTAKVVMEKMRPEDRYPYVAGVVEGLAFARFARDGKKTKGMSCIYSRFYENRPPLTRSMRHSGSTRILHQARSSTL